MSILSPESWKALSPYLDRALDMPAEERARWLEALSAEDPALAAQLRELLEEHRALEQERFLEQPHVTAFSPSLAGVRIGAYQILQAIGEGGMGTVWLAKRVDGEVQQNVAIKLLRPSNRPTWRDRFLKERQFLANLNHSAIARLLDAGQREGQPYLIMEFVDGVPIDVYAANLPLRDKIALFLKVCDGVSHAHRRLIVHRDLKPSNILVDNSGQPKLLDFGIAKLLDETGDATQTIERVLTPNYASPEQFRGEPQTVATDIYSLGAVLYALVTGRSPHEAGTETTPSLGVVNDGREIRLPTEIDPAIPKDFDSILGKALRFEPEERYVSVDAFSEDLRAFLERRPVKARSGDRWYRLRRTLRRHWIPVTAALVASAALIAGASIALWQAQASARERDIAFEELRRAEATNDFSSYLLSRATPAAGKPISNAELLARGEALIAARFRSDPTLHLHLLLTLADRYWENQQFQDRTRILKQAYDLSPTIADAGLRSLAVCQWASQVSERGDRHGALTLLDEVLPLLSSRSEYTRFESRCRTWESIISRRIDPPRSIRAAERALLLEERRGGAPGSHIEALAALASAYSASYRYQDANRTYERWARFMENEGQQETREMAILLNNWSLSLRYAGQMSASLRLAERAVNLARRVDSEHGAGLDLLATYGIQLREVGRYDEARQVLQEALDKARQAGSATRLFEVLRNWIELACDAGDPETAQRFLAEQTALAKTGDSTYSYRQGIVLLDATRIALEREDFHRAVQLGKEAEPLLASQNVTVETALARALNGAGQHQEALRLGEQGVRQWTGRMGGFSHSATVGKALLEVAAAKAGLGDVRGARNDLKAVLEHMTQTAGPESRTAQRAAALDKRLNGH